MSSTRRSFISKKAAQFSESVIREMTRLAQRHQAVNLAQGFPDFPAPSALKEAAKRAIDGDKNQYAITWGAKAFRDALAKKHERASGIAIEAHCATPSSGATTRTTKGHSCRARALTA